MKGRLLLVTLASLWWSTGQVAYGADLPDPRVASYAAVRDRLPDDGEALATLRALADGDFLLADYAAYDLAVALHEKGETAEALALLDNLVTRFPDTPALSSAQLLRIRYACVDPASQACGDRLSTIPVRRLSVEGQAERLFLEAAWLRSRGRTVDGYKVYQKIYYNYPLSGYAEKARQQTVILRRVVTESQKLPWPTYRQRMGRVDRLMKAWEYKQAEQELNRMATAPYDVRQKGSVLFMTGMARYRGREREGAKRTFEEYLRRYPKGEDADEARYRIGLVDWNHDRNEAAITSLTAVANTSRSRGLVRSSLLILGRIAEEEGRFADALVSYRGALRKGGTETFRRDLRWRIGWLLYRTGADAEATRALDVAMRKTPMRLRDGRFLFWQAKIAERGGRLDQAEALRDKLVEQFPETFYGATIRFERERPDVTAPASSASDPLATFLAVYDPAQRLSNTGQRHWRRFEALLSAKMFPRARIELDRLFEQFHHRPDADDALWTGLLYQRAQAPLKAMRLQGNYFDGRDDKEDMTAPFWSLYYPRAEWERVSGEAERNGVDPFLILSIIRQESAFDPNARSSADARGLMQLIPSTGERVWKETGLETERKRKFGPDLLFDPAVNIRMGVAYFAGLLKRYEGRVSHALAAYNAGESAVDRWRERYGPLTDEEFAEMIPYRETRGYVKKILRNRAFYRALHRVAPPATPQKDG